MDDTKDDHGSQEPVALFAVPNTIATIDRLARMDPIGYDLVREFHAKELGIRVSTLDNVTKNRRKALGLDADTSQPVKALDDVEPWDLAVRGDELLTEIKRALKSHVVLADAAATAVSLWVLHAHAHDTSHISPIRL